MSVKHTPGKLQYAEGRDAYTHQLRDESGNFIVAQTSQSSNPVHEADARRLVACWNAFDGVETEKFQGKTITEFMSEQAFLVSAGAGTDSFDINLKGGACMVLASCFAGQFTGSGATNFLEVGLTHPDIGPFTVTIQRVEGRSPAFLKADADRCRDKAMAMLADCLQGYEKAISALDDAGIASPQTEINLTKGIRSFLKGETS